MKIGYYSDLHLEFENLKLINDEADVVVLAGDIHSGVQGVKWASNNFKQQVIMIPGNHEFYTRKNINLQQIIYGMRTAAKGTNVNILNNENIVIDGVNFIGSTLWTDFNLYGKQDIAMLLAGQMINDYSFIKMPTEHMVNRLFTTNDALALYKEAIAFIHSSIQLNAQNVIITHYGVDERCSNPRFHRDHLTAAFNSDLKEFITTNKNKITAWIYGHTHFNLDFEIENVPILTNQRGYAPEELVSNFKKNKLLYI